MAAASPRLAILLALLAAASALAAAQKAKAKPAPGPAGAADAAPPTDVTLEQLQTLGASPVCRHR